MNFYLFVLEEVVLVLKVFVVLFEGVQLGPIFLEEVDFLFEFGDDDLLLVILDGEGGVNGHFRGRVLSSPFGVGKLGHSGGFTGSHAVLRWRYVMNVM